MVEGHGGTIANDPFAVTSNVSSMEAQGETVALHIGNGTNKKEGGGKGIVTEVAQVQVQGSKILKN